MTSEIGKKSSLSRLVKVFILFGIYSSLANVTNHFFLKYYFMERHFYIVFDYLNHNK